ncbi:MAG: ArnT family glycosyltransferase [Ardenticatenaceae bacterium]
MKLTSKQVLIAVFLLSFLTRSLMLIAIGPDIGSNSGEYRIPAENLAQHGALIQRDDLTGEWLPFTFRTPGYSLYIGLFYTLFGITDTAHYAIAFSQVLFASIMAVIAAYIGSRYFSPKIGLMAGAFSALDPWLSFSTIAILNDNPFSFAYTLSFLLGVIAIEKLTWRWALLWGLTLGLATFIRPLPKYHVAIIILIFALSSISWQKKFRLTLVSILGFSLLVGGWSLRNRVQTGHWDLETNQGMSMLWRTAHLTRESTPEEYEVNPTLARARDITANTDPPYGGIVFDNLREEMGLSEREANELMVTIAYENVRLNPMAYVQRGIFHSFSFQTGIGMFVEFAVENLNASPDLRDGVGGHLQKADYGYLALNLFLRLSTTFIFAVLFPIGLIYAWFRYKEARLFHLYFILALLYHFAVATLVIGQDRYRLPLHGVMFVYISCAIIYLQGVWEKRNQLFQVSAKGKSLS